MPARLDRHQYNVDFLTLTLGGNYTDNEPTFPLEGRGVVLSIKDGEHTVTIPAADANKFYGMILDVEERGTAGDASDARTRIEGRPVSVLRRGHYPRAISSGSAAIAFNARVRPTANGFWEAVPAADLDEDTPCRAYAVTPAGAVKGTRFAIDLR